jgi:hypothetical protein
MNIIKQIRYFIQRGKRGYSDCDLWGFDCYLSSVISKGLRQLSNQKESYPVFLKSVKQWGKILNKIADGIEAPNKSNEDIDLPFEEWKSNLENSYKKQQKALKLFSKYFNNFWD